MSCQDIETRRARDLERYHRRTAERRARGLCLKCGKQPPPPERGMCEPCAAKQRPADRERFHKRVADRVAQGLCPRCGKQPPAPGLSVCEPCGEKHNRASRVRDAKLRAAGKPRRDRTRARAYENRRRRRQTAERLAAGLCPNCGKQPPAPDASLCTPRGEQRREAERARYATAMAAGKLYGGRNPEQRRKLARAKSERRLRKRLQAGLCTRCGHQSPVEGGATYCGPCAVLARSRRSPEAKNAAARRLYARRRAKGLCTDCAEPSQGAARCEPCARDSYERSQYVRGIPVWDPQFTVIELATGEDCGTYDSEAEVAACLAFARLSWEQVEVISDISPMAVLTAWT